MTVLHVDIQVEYTLTLTVVGICGGTSLSVVSPTLTHTLLVNGNGATKAS